MISRPELERLAALKSDDGILSVYIKIDPQLAYARQQPLAGFRSAYAALLRTAGADQKAILEREKPKIESFLGPWEQKGRALVIFSSTPAGIWEVLNLNVALPTWVAAGPGADTAVLTRLLDEYPRMAVVLLDGEQVRVYLGEQRQVEREAELQGDIPGRHDQGGWSQARYQRHIEFHREQLLKEVVEEVRKLFYAQPFDRLILVGVDETVNELRDLLPVPLQRRVIGHFHADFKQENDESILRRAGELRTQIERQEEIALVDSIVDAAEAGGRGAIGLEPTIRAVFDGRVETLAVADGVTAPGSLCTQCGYFSSETFDTCPACGGPAEAVPDIVDQAAEQAFLKGAKVNTVFADAAEKLIARGGLGAVLRY
jgi:peptide chain release factor subunit 1